MNIVVPIKLVPDLVEELEINADGTDLDRDALTCKINEFDDHALEEALLLKEAVGGTVTVLALDGDETDKILFTAIAKGADRAVKITGLAPGAASRATAKAMSDVIRDLAYDFVFTGVQAADDRDGQLPGLLAAFLGIPHLSVVTEIAAAGGGVRAHKEYAGGVTATFEVAPRAVLGVQAARQTPRYAPVSRVRQVMKEASIDEVEAGTGEGAGAGAEVRRVFKPSKGRGAEMIEGSADAIAERLSRILKEKRG